MAEGLMDLDAHGEQNKLGPDLFGFYKCEILELLNHDENILPLSSTRREAGKVSSNVVENGRGTYSSHVSSLFSNSIEDGIADVNKELLKTSLRQSVRTLTQEVDEVFDPIIRIRHVISCLNSKRGENYVGKTPFVEDSITPHYKKLKTSSSNVEGELLVDQNGDAEKDKDVSVDLKLLLESDNILVEEIMTKHSNELLVMLNHMEKQLEELLYGVVSKCRLMTPQEKQHLRKLIEKLPARNLDRVVEIIHHGKSLPDTVSLDKICVDLEKQENTTLWRLYFYVKAVENAKKFSV